ncbi:YbaK/aminoacyl-tRNA synthetase-associated domain [Trypanosoma melophagium]|uniref:YbaK/aminoacyl-tRNA synthetase-associated domain n=1 Tax=Trypanosoma melophagium TaxID=715481 RepID=UPI00351A3A3B|nr:YbaK/aminoacyl-tRNA synthetase-associated domain [Trypanosoma melophagium]
MAEVVGLEKVKQYLLANGAEYLLPKLREFPASSATVELAAQQLSCSPAMIAKTLSFSLAKKKNDVDYIPILILAAGDAKVNTNKYRNKFARRPEMIKREDLETVIGFPAGGVCPFGVKDDVRVFLDVSLRRFKTVYPAAGTSNSTVPMEIEELERFSRYVEWVDVCDGWQQETQVNVSNAPQHEKQDDKKEIVG